MRLVSRVFSAVKIYTRRTFSTPARKPPHVDVNKKLIYGGDLSAPPSEESFGSLLFKRMSQTHRRDSIFQICTETNLKMTTGEFLKSSVAVAQGMKAKGAEKGDCILLLGPNSLDINVVLMAALFIAAVPLPISYKMTIETFYNIIKRMEPKFFWCEESYLYSFKAAALEVGKMDPEKILVLNQKGLENFTRGIGDDIENFQPTDIKNSKEELALALNAVTHGDPDRTVGLTHHNLNSIIARYDDLGSGKDYSERVCLMVQKVFWISGIYPLLLSCAFGSKLVIMNIFRESNFLKYIDEYQVTDVHMYLSKWWSLFKYNTDKPYNFTHCKWAYSINDSVSQVLKDGLKEKYGLSLRSTYGLSEMSGLIFQSEFHDEKSSSVGKLFPELYAKVVSLSSSRPLEANSSGELCFKGPTISKGYIKNIKATQQLFDREGFLLSGYCGYYEESGHFYVIDKIAYQIQYKEYQISPKDIEGVILSHPGVKDVCVTEISHRRDGAFLIALVVLQKGEKITEEEVAAYVNG